MFWLLEVAEAFTRLLLVVLSAASFRPQLFRILERGDCDGVSMTYVLCNLIVATFQFIIMFIITIMIPRYSQAVDICNGLDFAQFAVVFVGHVVLFFNILELPPHLPWKKRSTAVAYIIFLLLAVLPTIECVYEQDAFLSGIVFEGLLYFLGPAIQVIGIFAFIFQAWEIMSRNSPDALSLRGLSLQAVMFLLVEASFLYRSQISRKAWDGRLLNYLWGWYWATGWANVNTLIFALSQGLLALMAWTKMKRPDRDRDAEREPLFAQ